MIKEETTKRVQYLENLGYRADKHKDNYYSKEFNTVITKEFLEEAEVSQNFYEIVKNKNKEPTVLSDTTLDLEADAELIGLYLK